MWAKWLGRLFNRKSTCCTSMKGPEFDPQNPSKKIGTFVMPALGRQRQLDSLGSLASLTGKLSPIVSENKMGSC